MRYRFTVAGRRYLQAPSLLLLGQYSTSFHDTDLLVIQLLRFTCSNFFFLTYFFYYTRLYTPDFCFYFYSDPICHIQFVVREHRLSNSILRKPGAHTLFAANSLCYLPYYLHFYIYLRFQFCFLLPFCMLHDTH